jgi:glycosyltransferase involved in cell wall biosynthesis
MQFSVFILTFNDEKMISRLLEDLINVENVIIVDSGSTDETIDICNKYNRRVVYNKFKNQAIQSNWAIDNLFQQGDWVLRLDSDERVSKVLLKELDIICANDQPVVGYLDRRMYWMGKRLNYSSLRPLFLGRLFKVGYARYEEVTEEHLLHECPSVKLKTIFYEDNIKNDMKFWLDKHYKTAEGEVQEFMNKSNELKGNLFSPKQHERTRFFKLKIYNKLPSFIRPILYFIYRYFLKLGFLDGRAGYSYCLFQALFYRSLVDQLIIEMSEKKLGNQND